MAKIGVLIEIENHGVKKANFGVMTAARQKPGDEIFALVFKPNGAICKEAVREYGAQKIVEVSVADADFVSSPDLQASALAQALTHFEINVLLGLSSAWGRDLLARVAARMDAPLVLDCVGVNLAEKMVAKSHFSGKTLATLQFSGNRFFCGLRPNVIEAVAAPCEAELAVYAASGQDSGKIKIKQVKKGESERVDLTEADIIISGGRAMGSAENFKVLYDCAEVLGAAVGASRAAVDSGYAPHSLQVGQTGKTVSPKLYIACGISGSVQHFAGMRTSKVIVGVNTDREAQIFNKCDYGIVGDLFEVVPALTQALKKRQTAP